MSVLSFALLLAGFACIATTMHATPRRLWARKPAAMRAIGWGAVTLSLLAALASGRWDYGLIAWLGLALPAGLLVAAMLSTVRAPQRRRPDTSAPASRGSGT